MKKEKCLFEKCCCHAVTLFSPEFILNAKRNCDAFRDISLNIISKANEKVNFSLRSYIENNLKFF